MEMDPSNDDCTPPDLKKIAQDTAGETLPEMSKARYENEYQKFLEWCSKNNVPASYISEHVVLAWAKAHEHLAPTTIWTKYSMIKRVHDSRNPDSALGELKTVDSYLTKRSKTWRTKSSLTFSRENIMQFIALVGELVEYEVMILVSLFAIFGAMRKGELTAMTLDDIKVVGNEVQVKIPKSKSGPRAFVLIDGEFKAVQRFKQYLERRQNAKGERLWLRWQKTRYSQAGRWQELDW